MTIDEIRFFEQGRDYWYQYIQINGYSFKPTEQGIKRLSKNIDINISWLKKCINLFLNA